jgi:NADH dehydrogenase [ubiquinone] 1 alpha subcomplex assembly factor 7
MNPLEMEIAAMIEAEGPIGVDRFMALALGHPRYGYYMTRNPLGTAGDFITAPEISQMFGELLGLLAGMAWQSLGEPKRLILAELGPGRGTLMADMLRAAKAVPGFLAASEIHLVEMSPALQRAQAATLREAHRRPEWHPSIDTLPGDAPIILVANEFFDALPIRQFQRVGAEWRERMIGLDARGRFTFGLDGANNPAISFKGPEGAIFETCPIGLDIMRRLSERISRQRGVMLAIDYGHAKSGFGDTLQAVRQHRYASVLADIGEADLTAHVDFATLAIAAQRGGAKAHPVLTQGTLLERLGIKHRAEILKRKAPDPAEIDAAVERLSGTSEQAMGVIFKALAVTDAATPAPAGFDRPDLRLPG